MLKKNYTEASLCFLIRNDEVLLAEKQKKIGAGFLNGFGGKAEPSDRNIEDTNIRETEEEIGVSLRKIKKMGEITFHNPSKDVDLQRMNVHIFIATNWTGEPTETDEMKKVNWYKIDELDYDKFLPADRLFIPQILDGKCVKGIIEYNNDWSVKASAIEVVS